MVINDEGAASAGKQPAPGRLAGFDHELRRKRTTGLEDLLVHGLVRPAIGVMPIVARQFGVRPTVLTQPR